MPALEGPHLLVPVGPQTGAVERFEWEPVAGAACHTFVLLDAGYRELARRDVGNATGWSIDAEVRALLRPGSVFHWFVLAGRQGGLVKSPIETFAHP